MRIVQVGLTEDQAKLLLGAAQIAVDRAEDYSINPAEVEEFKRLEMFLTAVMLNPEAFPATGRLAKTVKTLTRRAKGPAQPQSRRNRRKARQEQRQSFAKRRRQERKALAAAYNEARERTEAEMSEAEAAFQELRARIEAEPKFDIIGPNGEPILAGVPESFIRPVEVEQPEVPAPPQLYVAGRHDDLAS